MILNQASDGVLSVLIVLYRALLAYGPMPRQRLLDLCAPLSLSHGSAITAPVSADDEDQDDNPSEDESTADMQGPARKMLTRWCQIGFFVEAHDENRTISLAPDLELPGLGPGDIRPLRTPDVPPLRTAIRRLVLSPKNNLDIIGKTTKSKTAGVCADFTRALVWVLAQDVFAFPGGGDFGRVQELENEQFRSGKGEQRFYAFQNNTRWPAFRAWTPFLGFGWWSPVARETQLAIDPTDAVTDELSDVFGDDTELPVSVFIERLADRIPVLDGGAYRLAMERILRNSAMWRAPASHELSSALSRALARLQENDTLRLDDRADAPDRRTMVGRDAVSVQQLTHVIRTNTR